MALQETATFAGGCFWCLEAVYQQLKGVASVRSGFMGGTTVNPSYKAVCDETTMHAEVVQITYDPSVIGFATLINIFFATHDPTTLNRQGNDVGTRYRSAVFYHSAEQEGLARQAIANLTRDGVFDDPIVTQLAPASALYSAEDYHQNYYRNTGDQNPYCTFVISPKVAKFRKQFAALLS